MTVLSGFLQATVEGGCYRGDQECHEFGDVIEGVEVEDGLLDGGLAVCGDHGASKATAAERTIECRIRYRLSALGTIDELGGQR